MPSHVAAGPADSVSSRFQRGALAMVASLVVASVVAVALGARSPLEPIADVVMNRTPVQIAIPLLLRLGALSRPLALLGAVAISLAAGGLLGVVWPERNRGGRIERSARQAAVAAGLLILMPVIFPSGNVTVAGVQVLAYLFGIHLLGSQSAHSPSRRRFLLQQTGILGGIAVLVALLYADPLVSAFRTQAAGRRLFTWRPPRPRKPGFDIAGLTPEITPQQQFYVMDEDMQLPLIDVSGWSLSVEGLVRKPFDLSFADLLALPRRDQIVTQECVSNPVAGPLMGTALYSGVPIRHLLSRSDISRDATAVLFRSPDGHEEAIPLRLALDPGVMLVYARNGYLLDTPHGFPARVTIPGYYGYKSVKWVDTVRVTTEAGQGYWEREGWKALPAVHLVARIDVARPTDRGLLVAGVAFGGRRGIRSVQVRANGGPWEPAILHTPPLSPFSWVQWRTLLSVHGNQTIEARAIDSHGHVQTARVHGQKPDGATGYHSVHVTV